MDDAEALTAFNSRSLYFAAIRDPQSAIRIRDPQSAMPHSSSRNRAYPLRLTGSFVPSRSSAMRLSLA